MTRFARASAACLALLIVPGCRDEDRNVAGTDPGPARTRNGGATWASAAVPGSVIYDIQFLDSWRGWLTTDGTLYRSQDGGATWTAQETPDIPGGPYIYFSFKRVEFVDDRTGWVSGYHGNNISGLSHFVMKATPPEE